MQNLATANLFFLLFLSFKLSISYPQIEKQALLSFKQSLQDPDNLLSSWNDKVNCCDWRGVICSDLTALEYLNLRDNELSGHLTHQFGEFKSLRILDLSNNSLSGVIPNNIGNLSPLEYLYIDENKLTGNLPESMGQLFNLATLSMEENNLSGDVPKELTRLVELRSLNLSRNHLTGLIPDSIGNMKQLESLDFSVNSLSGEIPSSFTMMFSLDYLNLSYNDLTGEIPQSTQLLGFNASSFIGNNLCGPPLAISCGNDGTTTNIEDQDQEGEKAEIEWFYVFVSLGYAVGLSAFFTTLFLKKSWSEAYDEFLEDMYDSVYVYLCIKCRRLGRALGRNT
ncbi:probable inactive leucine-rich repeat receptor-like protein kinase at1g66830 [Phtheirospermum japonicum]|uniref:Probable inactive leucine-rich repeat receptor-like protein kinase at1g66830 n=1 Tax=Phtheirospermum japonicum TaxID=374723 RepID=A0A830CK27_9LAMI|nr:probable inactive leucine-rich repeat receptor-like protein kinase at1g66830 [Phtheirospermum japonicum]